MSAQGWMVLAVVVIVTQHSIGIDGAPLNDYILDYQPLHFDQIHLHDKHSRVRRSVDPYFRWIFKAYNRTFNVQLQPSSSIFAENHELIFGDEPPKKVDTSFIYEGILAGEPSSSVHMSIIDGSVSGHIIVPGHTTYHIEPARNHFNHSDFHTIIYPESRMNLDPYRHKRSASGICGDREVYEKLSKMWGPVEEPSFRHIRESSSEHSFHNKYSAEANSAKSRQRRQLEEGKKTCFMSLRADKLLYDHFMAKTKNNAEKAKEEILSLFGSHVKALNDIYLTTLFNTFDNTISYRGVGFQLQRSTVITGCGSGTNWRTGYCTDNLDVSNFLDLTADENHDTFCLLHTFTYRDFVGGTLGLAWVATPDSRNSGVCGKYGAVRDDKNGISDRSLNTGIVTLINFNQEVPTRVSQLTFAHEVGHNFGAQHDAKAECAPYGTSQPDSSSGNYIMFPSATQGNLPNNAKFSSCSKNDIAKVLDTLAPKGKRNNCFQTSQNAFCGNGVVELSEKCDCGYQEDCKDECCNYQTDTPSNSSCTLRKGDCSPTQGQCCASLCTYEPKDTPCLAETDCNDASRCNGAATCPPPLHKANKTFCNNFNKVCELGECIGSVCSRIDWIECFMTVSQGATDEQMCYISCKKNESSDCISSYDQGKVDANLEFKNLLTQIHDSQKSTLKTLGLKRPSGSPCNDYKGFCDVFSKCKNVDAEGPFKQLTDLIFNPLTLRNIRTWIEDHWWAVLLMCVGVVVFMGVFIKIFGYNTPSKNPKKKPQGPLAGRSVPAGPRPASRAVAPKPRHEQVTMKQMAQPRAHHQELIYSEQMHQPAGKAKQWEAGHNRDHDPYESKQNVYATDLPMYARPTSDRGRSDQHIYDRPDYNDGKYGYDNQAFQGPSHSRGHQQYDRIAGSRNY